MGLFKPDIAVIRPEPSDVIVIHLDTDTVGLEDIDDFNDTIAQIQEAFPRNRILILAKSDALQVVKRNTPENTVKQILGSLKCPQCNCTFDVHDIEMICPNMLKHSKNKGKNHERMQ